MVYKQKSQVTAELPAFSYILVPLDEVTYFSAKKALTSSLWIIDSL